MPHCKICSEEFVGEKEICEKESCKLQEKFNERGKHYWETLSKADPGLRKAAEEYLSKFQKEKCVVCSKDFVFLRRGYAQKVCSKVCRKALNALIAKTKRKKALALNCEIHECGFTLGLVARFENGNLHTFCPNHAALFDLKEPLA